MPVNYVGLEQARQADGLRMVVVGGIPSPWGEAAKGILKIKGLDWLAVRLDQRDDVMAAWTGCRNAPVLMLNGEAPRSDWQEILLLAERLSPEPALLPAEDPHRTEVLTLCAEICGVNGLGWFRRLDAVHRGLQELEGFPPPVASYLGKKYGYDAANAGQYVPETVRLLNKLSKRLQEQQQHGSRFYYGEQLSAVDIYAACFMALFRPLAEEVCPMPAPIRSAFSALDERILAALDERLLEHRDFIYQNYLELPLSL